MARIKLSSGFEILPEGKTHFVVESVEYKEAFGKLEIVCKADNGLKHTERYCLVDNNGNTNNKAMYAFSCAAKVILNNPDLEEIDETDLVGKSFYATVEHQKVASKNDPEKELTFVHLKDYEVDFNSIETDSDGVVVEKEQPKTKEIDLSFLN